MSPGEWVSNAVALLALVVAWMSYRYAKRAPVRALQSTLLAAVREDLEAFEGLIAVVRREASQGSFATKVDGELNALARRLEKIALRLTRGSAEIDRAASAAEALRSAWWDVDRLHRRISDIDGHLVRIAQSAGPGDKSIAKHIERETAEKVAAERALPAMMPTLLASLEESRAVCGAALRRLDALERRP